MKLFRMRQPRHYRRVSIYTDADRDHLQKLVDDVRREQGEAVQDEPYDPAKFKGAFSSFTPRAEAHKERGGLRISKWYIAMVLIFALFFGFFVVMQFLATGLR